MKKLIISILLLSSSILAADPGLGGGGSVLHVITDFETGKIIFQVPTEDLGKYLSWKDVYANILEGNAKVTGDKIELTDVSFVNLANEEILYPEEFPAQFSAIQVNSFQFKNGSALSTYSSSFQKTKPVLAKPSAVPDLTRINPAIFSQTTLNLGRR